MRALLPSYTDELPDMDTPITEQLPFILGRIEGNVALILTRLDTRDKEVSERFSRAEARVEKLESKASRAFGIGAGFAAAGTLLLIALKYATGVHL